MIVVIGASGFIGTYLVDELVRRGKEVVGTGRDPRARQYYEQRGIPLVPLDMANAEDFNALPTEGVEGVILLSSLIPAHAANIPADAYVKVNTLGTLNVLEYCRRNGIKKIINTSSQSDVQNLWSQTVALDADTPPSFKYTGDHAMYIISKVAAHDCLEHYCQEFGLQGATFRLPAVYGYGPHLTAFINGKLVDTGLLCFINRAREGEPVELWGDPDAGKDLLFVKDAAAAYIAALESDKTSGMYNISTGHVFTLRDIAQGVIEVFCPADKRSEMVVRPEKKSNMYPLLFDISKAKRDFGWAPKYTTFVEMMQDLKDEMEAQRFPHLTARIDKS